MTQTRMTAGKVARAANINVETLRYYEQRSLLPKPARSPSGYRVYTKDTVDRLQFIKGAQALGFRLDEIRELLEIQQLEAEGRAIVRQHAIEKIAEIERKMSALAGMRDALLALVEQCHGDGPLSECPILRALPTMHESNL